MPNRILIAGGRVLGDGADPHLPPVADVLIEDREIAAVGPNLRRDPAAGPRACDPATEIIDASGRLVIPGLVNAHYHSHDILTKGMLEELPLEMFGLYARPQNYPRRTPAEIRARTLLGAAECIRNGITTLQDMHFLFPEEDATLDAVLGAYDEIGIRAVFALQVSDLATADTVPFWRETVPPELLPAIAGRNDDPERLIELVERPLKRASNVGSRLTWALGPSAPQRCSETLLRLVADLNRRHRLPVFTHLYETKAQAVQARLRYPRHGGSLVRLLADVGLLDDRLSVAHAVWLTRDEMTMMAEAGAGAVLNPLSNMKLKSGVAPILELRAAGVRLALGCDNCSCSDVQSLFQGMKMFCLLAAVSDPEPRTETGFAEEAIRLATQGGARALGLGDRVGAIRPGLRADLAILDLGDPAFLPLNSASRQLVYGESGRAVETVLVDGRVVMRARKLATIDEDALRQEIQELGARFHGEYAEVKARNERLLPHLKAAHRKAWGLDVGLHRFVGPPKIES